MARMVACAEVWLIGPDVLGGPPERPGPVIHRRKRTYAQGYAQLRVPAAHFVPASCGARRTSGALGSTSPLQQIALEREPPQADGDRDCRAGQIHRREHEEA